MLQQRHLQTSSVDLPSFSAIIPQTSPQTRYSQEKTQPSQQVAVTKGKRVKGMLLMLITVFFYHLSRLFIKLSYVYSEVSIWEGLTIRTLAMSMMFFFTVLAKSPKLFIIPKGFRLLILYRCIVGTISFSLVFAGLKYLTYSTSMILYFLYPLYTSVLARIFLKESLSVWDLIALIISFFGVVLFAFPQTIGQEPISSDDENNSNTPPGLIMGLIQPIFMAGVLLTVRKIGKNVHFLVSPAYYSFFSLIFFSVLCVIMNFAQGYKTEWDFLLILYLSLAGVFEYLGQMTITCALQYEKAGRVAALEYVQVILGFVLELVLFKGEVGIASIVGSVLITGSSLTVTLLKCTGRIK